MTTFTGNSRPRRQVNLSGRNSNPFATVGNRSSPSPAHNAVAHAQQERIQRQRERERPPAATAIQRVWRGYRGRSVIRSQWREAWDNVESLAADHEVGQDRSCNLVLVRAEMLTPNSTSLIRPRRFASINSDCWSNSPPRAVKATYRVCSDSPRGS